MNILKVNRPSDYSSYLGVTDRLTCKLGNSDILTRFHEELKNYYSSEHQLRHGIPTI